MPKVPIVLIVKFWIFLLAWLNVNAISVQISEPVDGASFSPGSLLDVHVRVSGSSVAVDTMADLYLDAQLLGSLPNNEVAYQIDASQLVEGDHRISVILTDMSDQPLGIEAHSSFRILADPSSPSPAAQSHRPDATQRCGPAGGEDGRCKAGADGRPPPPGHDDAEARCGGRRRRS